jgi:hypothetical protein
VKFSAIVTSHWQVIPFFSTNPVYEIQFLIRTVPRPVLLQMKTVLQGFFTGGKPNGWHPVPAKLKIELKL